MYALRTSATTTIGADGTATLTIGPTVPFTSWHVTTYSVQTTPLACNCHVYKGQPNTASVLDYTFQGGADTSPNNNIDLFPGEYLTVVWDSATPGAQALFTILEGIVYEKGR